MNVVWIIVGMVTAAWLWARRAHQAKDVADNVVEMARDVRLNFRRLGFKRRSDLHAADCVEDPRLAVAGIVAAIARMRGPLSTHTQEVFTREVMETFKTDPQHAADIVAFGQWVARQCATPELAAHKLGAVIRESVGEDAMPEIIWMIERVTSADGVRADESQYAVMSVFQAAIKAR